MNKFYTLIALMLSAAVCASAQSIAIHEDVAPLTTSQWGQDAPYHDLCPNTYPTGCTATAAAQIMYYYKYPAQGTGSISYTWNSKTLSIDFSQSTYNWGAMLTKVKSSSADSCKTAVATLMRDAGYACQMNYASRESIGYTYNMAYGLGTYFTYDKGIHHILQEMYNEVEWDSIIYNEIANGRPVIYTGYNQSQSDGHTFVIDGYKNGKWHVNFGWDGLYDNYYALDNLLQYSSHQEAVVGIQPDKGTKHFPTVLYNFAEFSTEKSSYNKGQAITFKGEFANRSVEEKTFRLGVECVKQSTGESTFVECTEDYTKTPLFYKGSYQVEYSKMPTATGNYYVYPAYRDEEGNWHRMRTSLGCNSTNLALKITFSKMTFSAGIPSSIKDVPEIADCTTSDDSNIYSLDGRRLQSVPVKGFYIKGGKKYYVK